MSKPISSIKSPPSNTSITLCSNCRGTGYVVIKNAYDPDYSEAEPCTFCGASGVILKPHSKDPN
jgi:DnaJ-class molecular chaperone